MRNFGIRNKALFFPMRLDQWIAGPLDVSLIAMAMIIIGMTRAIKTGALRIRSKAFFISKKILVLVSGGNVFAGSELAAFVNTS